MDVRFSGRSRAVLLLASALCCAVGAFLPATPLPSCGRISHLKYSDQTEYQEVNDSTKEVLLQLVQSTPPNAPTPAYMTNEILRVVRQLEEECPTPDDEVLSELAGNWELIWTTQDKTRPEAKRSLGRSWINPLENQSYSNNPEGRSNPFLPRPIQDRLEKLGLVTNAAVVQSTQAVDLKKQKVSNVVAFGLARVRQRASLTVKVAFRPSTIDVRRIDVKFESCRIKLPGTPIDTTIPLGLAGPIGWLQTNYIDENLRITRGHKGSVFVLKRPRRATV
jgi:hypothetical protein